jgi:hypothetical protein
LCFAEEGPTLQWDDSLKIVVVLEKPIFFEERNFPRERHTGGYVKLLARRPVALVQELLAPPFASSQRSAPAGKPG